MPGPAARSLYQTCTYWARNGLTDFGDPQWDAPVLLRCAWIPEEQVIRSSKGDEIRTQALVYTSARVYGDDYLALGDYTTADPAVDPMTLNQDAGLVQSCRTTPDLRNLEQMYEVIV
jgi:hypothetical protein